MDELTTPPAAVEPPQAARRRERKPKSLEARARGMVARKLQRELEAIKATKDEAKLAKAYAALKQLEGEGAAAPAQEAAPEKPAAPAAEPQAELRGTPSGVSPRGPAWPSEAAIAEFTPLVETLVSQLALVLSPTRYAIHQVVTVKVGETPVETSGAKQLTAALAPLAAKYLPSAMTTPELAALATVCMVFGGPAMQHLMEKMSARGAAPAAAA